MIPNLVKGDDSCQDTTLGLLLRSRLYWGNEQHDDFKKNAKSKFSFHISNDLVRINVCTGA